LAEKLTIRRIEDTSLWDDFVLASPQGTVFSTNAWLKTASAAQGGEPFMLGLFKGDRLAAGVSYIHLTRGLFKKATSPVMTPYGGIIYRSDHGKRHSEAESFNISCAERIIKYLTGNYHHVFLVHAPGYTDIRPFTWAGWTGNVRYTYILDITDTEKLWDLMERRVRTVIRKAEVTLKLGNSIDSGQFVALYEHIYMDRGSSPPVNCEVVKKMLDELLKTKLVEMRTVLDQDNHIISVIVFVKDHKYVFAWISGSLPEKNSSGAFSLLFWDAVKRYGNTHERLDMVGANIPSIAFFKKKFGGELTPYYFTERYSSRMIKTMFTAYSSIKRFKI